MAKDINISAGQLAEGKRSSEFKVVVGVMLAGVVNPFLERIVGVKIPEDVFIAMVGLAGGYLGSRTYLKKALK